MESKEITVLFDDTVATRESEYTTVEIKKAMEAREIMQQLGYSSRRDMIKMIVKGMMTNIPITTQDIIRADDVLLITG